MAVKKVDLIVQAKTTNVLVEMGLLPIEYLEDVNKFCFAEAVNKRIGHLKAAQKQMKNIIERLELLSPEDMNYRKEK